MLIATNRGAGQNIGFPDVCLTPVGPAPVPMPYPNFGMHVLAMPFSLNVFWTFMNALNLLAKVMMTLGMNAGVLHPLYMMMGGFTVGSIIVFVNFLPGIHLCCITYGNNYNNPVGGALVPSVTVVFITLRGIEPGRLSEGDVAHIQNVMRDEGERPAVEAYRLDERTAGLRVRAFATHTSTRVWNALRKLGEFERLVIDLRQNPGGDADAALAFAEDFVAPGTRLGIRRDDQRYDKELVARAPGPYRWPVAVVVDGGTASAAEVFAGALQQAGRAALVGEKTYGKGTAQRLVPGERGALYATVAEFHLADGTPIDGVGLTPDLAVDASLVGGDTPMALAEALLDEAGSAQDGAELAAELLDQVG